MPRNTELIQRQFGSKNPLPSIELADNALKLGGIPANLFALKEELSDEVSLLIRNIDDVIDDLKEHENDDERHLTEGQIQKINEAINAVRALQIANQAINDAKPGIVAEAVQTAVRQAEEYVDSEIDNAKADAVNEAVQQAGNYTDAEIANKLGELKLPTVTDPETGEEVEQDMAETLEQKPQNIINPEYFYRFKNLINNSSFEVFDGNTLRPLGWDNGVVSADASMFETYSLKLTRGQTAKQTPTHQADASWLKGAYDTDDAVLCFYHKFDAVEVRIYDVENDEYLELTELDASLNEVGSGTIIEFPYEANWNRYRCMVKFTPLNSTRKIRVEFTCAGGNKGECYIDAPSLEPYVKGEYPSIYKAGRYAISAYQVLNPPPADVDRFTPFEHLNIVNGVADEQGNLTYQEYRRVDGTLAIKREALNPDSNGYYQTMVETFYRKDGVTVNYVDTYTYTYSSSGAVLSKILSTTEVE